MVGQNNQAEKLIYQKKKYLSKKRLDNFVRHLLFNKGIKWLKITRKLIKKSHGKDFKVLYITEL